MYKTYSLQAGPASEWNGRREGSIKFSTNDEKLYNAVIDFVSMAVDALNYRDTLIRVAKVEEANNAKA